MNRTLASGRCHLAGRRGIQLAAVTGRSAERRRRFRVRLRSRLREVLGRSLLLCRRVSSKARADRRRRIGAQRCPTTARAQETAQLECDSATNRSPSRKGRDSAVQTMRIREKRRDYSGLYHQCQCRVPPSAAYSWRATLSGVFPVVLAAPAVPAGAAVLDALVVAGAAVVVPGAPGTIVA